MRITTRGRYALRASLALAILEKDGGPVPISALSEQEKISSVFLEQIFFRLRKAGIVASTRGPGGGFSFAQPLDKITVKSLIDAAGEKLGLTFCDKRFETCNRVGDCLSHHVWAGAAGVMNSYFEDITLASLLAKYADPAAASQKE